MTRRVKAWVALAVMAAAAGPAAGAAAAGGKAAAKGTAKLDLPVEKVVLPNGLTLLLLENHDSPTLGLTTAFRVGSASEWDGIAGTTHILEHMLFKGTDRIGTKDWEKEKVLLARIEELAQQIHKLEHAVPGEADSARLASLRVEFKAVDDSARQYVVPNELWGLYQNAGGQDMNADTGTDLTRYYLSLPANRLELWCYLESSRLRAPVLREFYTEKENIKEERRLSIDTQPQGVLYQAVVAAAFQAHRYGTMPIGWPSDVADVTRTQVEAYFKQYYAPNRMVVAIVGDMDAKKAAAMVQDYFGDIPRQPDPPPVVTVEPEQTGERRVDVEFDAEPRVVIAYHREAEDSPDEAVFEVIQQILSGGASSRFEKHIVEEQQLATSVSFSGLTIGEKYPTLAGIEAEPRAPHTTAEVEAAVYAELDKLAGEPAEPREIQKAKNQLEAQFVRQLSSNLNLAQELASIEAMFYDWRLILRQRDQVQQVTAEDIQRVARKTFLKKNRTVGTLVPVSAAPAAPAGPESKSAADAVMSRALEAMGGRTALAGVKDLVTDGALEITTGQGKMPATAHTEMGIPDHLYAEMQIMGQKQTRGFDGASWWLAVGGKTQDLSPDMIKEARASFLRDSFLFGSEGEKAGLTFQAQPDAADGSKVVQVTGGDGTVFTVTFAAKDGLPAAIAYATANPMTGAAAKGEDRFSDYRQVQGIMLPFQVETYLDGKLFVTQKAKTIAVNSGVDPRKFSRP